jgi:hypothetical protein
LYENADKEKESPLFKEIIQYCIAPGKSPNLDSIITYNYDDLLESHLNSLDIDVPYQSVYTVGMNTKGDVLPIYHVHGYLPEEGHLTTSNNITLSESIYHQQYNDVYSWNNIVQINKFRDYNCLFIGTSFSDPNLRRLLDIAMLQRGPENGSHYIIKRRYKEEDVKVKLEEILQKNAALLDEKQKANLSLNEVSKSLIKIMESFDVKDAESFGVSTIWVNEYDDIPNVLKEIRTNN